MMMTRMGMCCAAMVLVAAVGVGLRADESTDEGEGWVTIFDGSSMDGWKASTLR